MKNMGSADKAIRIIVAIALVVLAATGQVSGILMYLCYVFAAVFILTSAISMCPLYVPLGIKTCPSEKK